jgi:hypothetical protein
MVKDVVIHTKECSSMVIAIEAGGWLQIPNESFCNITAKTVTS